MGNTQGGSICTLMNPAHADFFGQTMVIIQLEPGNGYAPALTAVDGVRKFSEHMTRDVLRNNLTAIDFGELSGKNKTGWIELDFNDYEHFASCMLGKNLSNVLVSWKNAPADLETSDSTLHQHLSALSDKAIMFRILIKKPLRVDSRTDEERGGPAIYQYISSATELLLDGIESVEIM